MITSLSNQQVKDVIKLNQKAKARRENGLFVAEGRKMFFEAPVSLIVKVYIAESISDEEISDRIYKNKISYETVSDNVFRQMSDTKTPQGILTILKTPTYDIEKILGGEAPLVIILEDLQDPGNVGTIFRTAEGAGASGVILTKNSVDITNPKVIRSTMGSVYRVPYLYVDSIVSIKESLQKHGIQSYAAHLKGENTYDLEQYTTGSAFLIGNEGNGLTDEAAEAADHLIRIPMQGQLESLNAAMAAGILMYEAARQRR